MEITCRVYRPRRAREPPLFRLVERHVEELLRVWPRRFARTHGPLRPVVERVLREFLTCGLAEHGFARAWCSTCRKSDLIPYSCRGRSFCPTCEKKRSLLWAEWLHQEVLAPVPHRHVVNSTLVGEPIPPNDARAIEDMASYVVRNPISLKRLVYIDAQQAVIYRALKPNPRLGANFVAMDPLEWLARMADHIPDPGKHRTLFYSYYGNRARGARAKEKELLEGAQAEAPKKRRCSPSCRSPAPSADSQLLLASPASQARLISKVYNADPLTCRECGGALQIVAYINDHFTIKRILDHFGLSPPEIERPPPQIRYVPVDHEGRELEAMVAEGLHSP